MTEIAFSDIPTRKQLQDVGHEPDQFLKSILDGLSAHIAVVDAAGKIILVNKSYRDFADRNGSASDLVSEEANYLAVCDSVQARNSHQINDSEDAKAFAQGFRDVAADKYPLFELEYPCHSPHEQRWFIARITSIKHAGETLLVVAHQNITFQKLAMEKIEAQAEELFKQVDELHRWQKAMFDREDRIITMKQEINALLAQLGQQPRYLNEVRAKPGGGDA